MSGTSTEHAIDVVLSLDGTYGRTWIEVADDLAETASEGMQVSVDAGSMARLIRALIAERELAT